MFLKRLKTLGLRKNGNVIRRFERVDDDQNIILSDGDSAHDTIWHLLSGDFSVDANVLRSVHPGRIETKRHANVTLAIDPSLTSRGLLWACLPTEHELGLPFHVNADFFPTPDRKRILFDQDYQAEWNRLAIQGAADVLAKNAATLTHLLGPVQFWTMVQAVKAAAEHETLGEEASAFWSSLRDHLRFLPTVFTTRGTWTSAEQSYLLQSSKEADAIEVLNGLGIELVHENLRPFQTLLRKTLEVPILEVSHLTRALIDAGLNRRRLMSEPDLPECLRSDRGWDNLWNEVAILLERRQSQAHARRADEELIRSLAIAPGRDGAMWPCQDVFDAEESTIKLFGQLGLNVPFISDKATFDSLRHLCSSFGVSGAIDALSGRESILEEACHRNPELLVDLFAWLEDRRSGIVANDALKQRIRNLRVFPSANSLRRLDELSLPGEFNDPIGLTDLVDVSALGARRDFLADLGMRALDFNTYVSERVPAKVRDTGVAPEKLRELLILLATHLGEFRDNTKARQALSEAPLVEGTNGTFHVPSKTYFDTPTVRECLTDRYPIVRLPGRHTSAVRELLSWLGVKEVPRFLDLCTVIESIVRQGFTVEQSATIQALFAHLTTRITQGQNPSELVRLKTLAWLPARGKHDRWYAPAELYASYQAYLFESEGLFLDVSPKVQNGGRPLLDCLGVHATPETIRVVKHLLNSVDRGTPVNTEVYRVLNERASEAAILLLSNTPCLWIDGVYRSPRDVFWQPHPFGVYRTRLSQTLTSYRELLDRLDVRESPAAADAVNVVRVINDRFGTPNQPLNEDAHSVVMACWQFLDRAFDAEPDTSPAAELSALQSLKCIPNADRLLMLPSRVFFENRAGLAAKFGEFLASNVIPRPIGSARAMAAAGVKSLGSAVQLEVLDLVDAMDDSDTTHRLSSRRPSIARVLEAQFSGSNCIGALARLDELACQRSRSLSVRWRLQTFGWEVKSPPETVQALFDPQESKLTIVTESGKIAWGAVARELATALLPEEDPGRLAAGLKAVLAADDKDEARVALDELGFARLQMEVAPPSQQNEAGGTLGEDTSPPDDFPDPPANEPLPSDGPTRHVHTRAGDTDGKTENTNDTPSPYGDDGSDKGRRDKSRKGRQQPGSGKQRQEILRSYIVPADPNARPSEDGGGDQRQRSATDEAGIVQVLDLERRSGRVPTKMHHTNPGYDIESRDGKGIIVRYIEVKSFSGSWVLGRFADLSRTQFDKARALDDKFWLYVVERAGSDSFRIHRIPNPAANATRFMFDDGWTELGEKPEYPERPPVSTR